VALAMLLAFAIAGVKLFGLQVYAVLSSSMEPEYKTGALIYVKKVDPKDLEVGDVITFMISKETTATHRIVDIQRDENNSDQLCFKTKGDANKIEDSGLVHQANVLGTPVFNVPYLGYIANFIKEPPGMYLSVCIGLILIIFVFMSDYLTSEKEDK
jgi:signal peptidase